jgi:hypothetical protein
MAIYKRKHFSAEWLYRRGGAYSSLTTDPSVRALGYRSGWHLLSAHTRMSKKQIHAIGDFTSPCVNPRTGSNPSALIFAWWEVSDAPPIIEYIYYIYYCKQYQQGYMRKRGWLVMGRYPRWDWRGYWAITDRGKLRRETGFYILPLLLWALTLDFS